MGESPIGAIPGTGYGFLRAARAVIGARGGAGHIQARRVLPIVQRWPTVGSAKAMTMGGGVYRHCSNG